MSIKRFGLYLVVAFLVVCIGLVGFASPAQAALVFHSGFEVSDFSEWSSVTGSPAVVETQKKTGTYAMQCDTTGGAATAFAISGTGDQFKGTFYLYIATAPDTECIILGNDTTGNIRLNTDRTLELYSSATSKDLGTTGLNTEQWYRICFAGEDAVNAVKVYIDGIEELTATMGAGDDRFKDQLGVITSCVADLYFDDFVSDDVGSDRDDLGDIRVAVASPSGAGTYAQYDTSSGFGNVDEIPASDVDFIEDTGSDAARESYNIPDLASLAGASSGDTVNAVSLWIRGDRDGGGATDHKAMVRDDGSDYESADLDFNGIAWFNWYHAVMPKDSAAWSEARLNSLEIGAYHLGAQDQRVHCLVAMVAYTPSAAEADISNTPDSENLGVVSANTTYYAYGSAPSNPVQDGECTFTVTNNSGANVDITVEADNFTGGVGWALTSGAPGENTVKMIAYYSGQDPASGVTLTTSPQAFISALGDNATKKWDFSLTTGTFTDGAEKTSLITLAASLS